MGIHTDSQVDNTLDDNLRMIHTDIQVDNTLDDNLRMIHTDSQVATLGMIHTDSQVDNTLDMAHYTAANIGENNFKPQNGANGQFNLIIKRLQENWQEKKDEKCFLPKTNETKKKIKFTQIGQTQKWMDMTHK